MNAPSPSLEGRTALVTGGGTGIGRSVAGTLAALGARVAVNHLPGAEQEGNGEELPEGCFPVAADVRDRQQVSAMFATVAERFGRLDILVNNAGVFPRAQILDLDESLWDLVLDTNLKGAFFCAQEAATLMIAQGGGGRIVNVSSSAAFTGSPKGAHYAASKAGLVALGKSLARALAVHDITVNTVAPGVTRTAQPELDEDGFLAEGRKIPLGRVAQPQDVANSVAFLVGDLGSYLTGQTLGVNGGTVMVP
ncbi:SDR family NAD(P)-dependent oxidoreductase [Streptomyces tubercidicus]|uniref:Beta-ketoacyl-ACP reductase n=1 Tax=Streptomyces tubercidicus TaxID=47759 RepID=A0A640UJX6_9ACTN|nr:SDR family oxidoreductase [Streptomyces tubercidicus]WAU11147.1 SDR family oxidoreductase [Streptomyces tubercidicus]GFE36368.1 beta-ketoacyl-ACP reductase [Streptomyces tubercidicus]